VSRASKRKNPAQAVEPDVGPDSDSNPMEVDWAKYEEQDDEDGPIAGTPSRSDTETDDEDENLRPPRRERKGPSLKPTKSSSDAQVPDEKVADEAPDEAATKSVGAPPPRSLPFGRPATRSKDVEKQPPPAAGDDEETEDEEL